MQCIDASVSIGLQANMSHAESGCPRVSSGTLPTLVLFATTLWSALCKTSIVSERDGVRRHRLAANGRLPAVQKRLTLLLRIIAPCA